jgi:hypothetical protein
MHGTTRRLVLGALAAFCGGALAQAQPVQLGTLGVFALLGDSVQVAAGQQGTGTRLDPTARESLAFTGIGFDKLALRIISQHVRSVQPAAKLQMYQAPGGLSLEQQRAIAAGAEKAQLPGWMVDAIERNGLTHLLIVTRARGPVAAETFHKEGIGRADVDGIGFYLDRVYQMRNLTTGAVSTGLIAPYVQIRLTLMDAQSGDVVGRHDIRRAYAYASEANQLQGDPWTYMSMEEKVSAIRSMVEQGIGSGMAELIKPR